MDTLPRFRLPDESSSRDVNAAAAASTAWEDFDDLDELETRVQAKENDFDGMPTKVHPSLGRKIVSRGPLKAVTAANVDDVVEELRAAAQGRKPRVRELASEELLEEGADKSGQVMEVDASELMVDRVVPQRAMWNVRQVARPAAPSIVGPTSAPSSRFIATAALAMLTGALLAIAAAFLVWRVSGWHL